MAKPLVRLHTNKQTPKQTGPPQAGGTDDVKSNSKKVNQVKREGGRTDRHTRTGPDRVKPIAIFDNAV